MSLTPALLVPWYWRFVQRLQGVVDTRPKQYLATVALPVGFLVAVFIIYLGSKPLKQRFTPELVEIARSLTVMGVALFDAILFVVIWRRFGETVTELDDFGGRLVPGTGTAAEVVQFGDGLAELPPDDDEQDSVEKRHSHDGQGPCDFDEFGREPFFQRLAAEIDDEDGDEEPHRERDRREVLLRSRVYDPLQPLDEPPVPRD